LVPYRQNPDFVGRSEILNEIKLQFGLGQQQEHAQPRRRVSLYGLGGVGKTQLALAYVYWIQETCPDISVFWVHASNADRFRAAYASIAEKYNIPGRDDPKSNILSLVKKWLEEQSKMQWLMVIDNADDIELFFHSQRSNALDTQPQQDNKLARYIPDCNHGFILLTTRNKQVGIKFGQGRSPPVKVHEMTDIEAKQLVQSILKMEVPADEISLLASKLEYLPLALAQATSFIQENTISISGYVQLLNEGDTTLVDQLSEPFETIGRDSETPHALTATWIISFRQIEKTQPLASDTLCFLSLLHRQAIPKTFTEEYHRRREPGSGQGSVSARLVTALGTLKAFSFISEGKDGSVDMHRLVQLVTRKWLLNKGRMDDFAECAIGILSKVYPYGRFETYQTCLKYLPHVNSVLATNGTNSKTENIDKAQLLHKLAMYYRQRGDWKNMERNLLQAAELQTRELGEEHFETLNSRDELASAYHYQGRLKQAEDLMSRIIKIRKRIQGDEHTATLASINNLSLTYFEQGRWKEAEELGIQVIEIRKKVFGEEYPDTLTAMNNLALTYHQQGRWKEAEELGVQVLEIRKKVLGEENPDTLTTMNNLAFTYNQQGRLKEAEELGVKVLEIFKKVLGEEHPDTLTTIGNLALTYNQQGRWKEAEDLEVKVLEIRTKVLGEEHRDTLTGINNLASTYYHQGRWKEAKELGVQVLEIRKKVLGEEHPDTLTSKHNLACLWMKMGRSADAIALMEECLSAMKRVLGEDHPNTVSSSSVLDSWRRDT
ncbi:uncharacterized protein TRIVIDRAFT_34594, partial [Trichoderma virens Gv29-8]